MAQNVFIKMRKTVQKEVERYDRIRKECGIDKEWNSRSIHRLANPFINGHFSLAVVGKMSSGKSTFINALIGKDILPTGHFQTTSTITYIESGSKFEMKVVYCDGHKEIFVKDISEKLKSLVTIPKEYDGLPINDINKLIAGGDDEAEILSKKDGIEEKTKYTKLDDSIWRKYIKEHKRKDIAEEVYITYPLSEEFEGWRIIDTPGVGAIGGIQDETKQLFFDKDDDGNRKVDAIIFLHSGTDNIEDESARDFMENLSKELTDEAKRRLFFILTKASERVFRQHKEETLTKAKTIYAEKFNIPQERFNYVDSLLCRFRKELEHKDKVLFGEIIELNGWDKDDLEAMTELFGPIKKAIASKGFEFNNESIDKIMKEWANFEQIKSMLNTFARKEKEQSLTKIKEYIRKDCTGFIKFFQKQKRLLEGGKEAIEKEKGEIVKKRIEYNKILTDLKNSCNEDLWNTFKFIDDEITKFRFKSIPEIRTSYYNLIETVSKTEEDIFNNIKKKFKEYCDKYSPEDIALDSIDMDALETQAEIDNTHEVYDISKPPKRVLLEKHRSRPDKYKEIYPKKNETDWEQTTRDFAAKVTKEAKNAKTKYENEFKKKTNNYYEHVKKACNEKIVEAEKQIKEFDCNLGNKDACIKNLDDKIDFIKNTNGEH
jgi:GTPase SAR1 family protein